MAKPAQIFRNEVVNTDAVARDAMIVKIAAAIHAYDSALTITYKTDSGAKKTTFSFTLDYVDAQSNYGLTVLAIVKAFVHVAVMKTTVTDTLI